MLYFNKSLLNYNKKQRITNNLTCYCNVMGRQTKVTAPGGVITNTTYYPTDEAQRVDGATYPVEYTYNGRRKNIPKM